MFHFTNIFGARVPQDHLGEAAAFGLPPPLRCLFLLGSSDRLAVLMQNETGPVFFCGGRGEEIEARGFSYLNPCSVSTIGWIVETRMRPVSAFQSSTSTLLFVKWLMFRNSKGIFANTRPAPLF